MREIIFESNKSTWSDRYNSSTSIQVSKLPQLFLVQEMAKAKMVKGKPKMDKDTRIPIQFQSNERNATKEPHHAPRTCKHWETQFTSIQ